MSKFFKKKDNKETEEKISRARKIKFISRLRGTKDILPDEYKYWNLVIKKATEFSRSYGFKRIDTPVLENLELYERSSGRNSDIVTKEMFSFIDKNGEKIALRPEATPGIVRSYIEYGMFNLPQPVKLFWLGQVFRHDKPQAGRFRQFSQFNLENIGDLSPVADAELIAIAYYFFSELQLEVMIQINSIGCAVCRKEYLVKLENFYKERGRRAKLCNDCKKRLVKNPLRLLDCKEKQCQEIAVEAPQIVDSLCDDCRNHFIKVLEYLDELNICYNLNPTLVRGLDYYNRTVFEIWPACAQASAGKPVDDPLRQNAMGGGGRYDGLVEYMGGRPTPACGFAIGIERVILKIKEKSIPLRDQEKGDLFLAHLGDPARRKLMVLFEELRKNGFKVRQAFTKDSLKSQLEMANQAEVKYTLILGQKEIMDGTILIRDMESGIQEIVDYKKVVAEIEKRVGSPLKKYQDGSETIS
ncbi:histidine--tRNA ligase [Patescibacteria group bacterium]|nr:histidine--tRNA ligase [Patescibacteria group bacterium]MBU1663590.1 histidine--tRNA ligase [Patescibacteria group bacterium]MBU1934133.1 histidine--tRNA ligase [Patescibacteria group bacterium]MBU2233997.1 histidine--tRNA ligase [Patescibacteria group bacterium]